MTPASRHGPARGLPAAVKDLAVGDPAEHHDRQQGYRGTRPQRTQHHVPLHGLGARKARQMGIRERFPQPDRGGGLSHQAVLRPRAGAQRTAAHRQTPALKPFTAGIPAGPSHPSSRGGTPAPRTVLRKCMVVREKCHFLFPISEGENSLCY